MLVSIFTSIIIMQSFLLIFYDKVTILMAGLFLTSICIRVMLSIIFCSWYGLILFLIYVTGLLVLFRYILAMSSVRRTPVLRYKFVLLFGILTSLVPLLREIANLLYNTVLCVDFELGVVSLYINFNINMYIIVVILLLVALVMVVGLCYKSPTPLRSFL